MTQIARRDIVDVTGMADSSLGFQNTMFTFGNEDEADENSKVSVVEIWVPYDRNLRMAADTNSALIEVEVRHHNQQTTLVSLSLVSE